MDARATLDALATEPELRGRLVYEEVLPARAARYAELQQPVHEEVAGRLAARGIDRLYTHQAAAIDALTFLFFVVPGCQIAACLAGIVAAAWTYSRIRLRPSATAVIEWMAGRIGKAGFSRLRIQ